MENIIDEAVCELKSYNSKNISVVIWGGYNAGQLGRRVADWLSKQDVRCDIIAPSDEFIHDGHISVEEYVDTHKCCIVVAFWGYREELLDKLNKDNIVKVYVADFAGRLAIGEDSKITENMLEQHKKELDKFRSSIADEKSLEALDTYIHQKMYGEYSKECSSNRQYFDDEIMSFGKDEIFVDCGAFDGADTKEFLKSVNDDPQAKAYVFEPDPVNCENIKKISAMTAESAYITWQQEMRILGFVFRQGKALLQ